MKTNKGYVKLDSIRKSTGFFCLFFFMLQTVLVYGTTTVSVSTNGPINSLSAARNEVRQLRQAGTNDDIIVEFQSGTYVETNTVIFGLQDSAPTNARTIYRAAPGATPIISAGQVISNWVQLSSPYPAYLPNSATGHVWRATVPSWVTSTNKFHVLYSGETMLQRSISSVKETIQLPGGSTTYDNHYKVPYKNLLRDWPNVSDIELSLTHPKGWCFDLAPLGSVVVSNKTAWLARACTFKSKDASFRVENAIDYLDEPGEWVLNTQDQAVYYWPKSGDPTTEKITAPIVTELVRVEGTNDANTLTNGYVAQDVPVRGLVFEGLTFTHADRDQIEQVDTALQAGMDTHDQASGLLRFRGAEDCVVSGCTFRDSGSDGVRLDLYCQNITVENSLFQNIGGTEFVLAGYQPGLKNVNHSNTIVNNAFLDGSQLLYASPAMIIYQSEGNLIAHNRIDNFAYCGLVISGTRLHTSDANLRTSAEREGEINRNPPMNWSNYEQYIHARNNQILYNEIRETGKKLGNGNPVYTSGTGRDNVVQCNAFYDTSAMLLRMDFGTYETKILQNVMIATQNTPQALVQKNLNFAQHNLLINSVLGPLRDADGKVSQNIFYHTKGSEDYYKPQKQLPDYNLFYNVVFSYAEAFAKSVANNSIAADPEFWSYDCANFSFQPGSPALDLGINEIAPADFDQIGLRSEPFCERLLRNKSYFLYKTPGGDSDADGLRDEWEVYYFGDLTPQPTDDPDGDGANNLSEFNAETNPTRDPANYADDKDDDGVDDRWEVLNYGSTWAYTPTPTNGPPRFRGLINGGKAYTTYSNTLAGTAIDTDDDPLTFTMISGSNWLSVATNGMLSGTPPVCYVEQTNYFSVQVDSTDGSDHTLLVIILADTVDPDAPTLDTPVVFDGKLTLSWSEPEANLTYSVYRSETSNSYSTALASNLTSAAYVDTDVVDGTTYYYIVKAADREGNESDASNEVSGTPINQAPFWNVDPVVETAAAKGVAYSSSLANDAADPGSDPLTFSKIDGSAWLNVAANGTLQGTPGSADLGTNTFEVSVSDGTFAVTGTVEIVVYSLASILPSPVAQWSATDDATLDGMWSDSVGTNDLGFVDGSLFTTTEVRVASGSFDAYSFGDAGDPAGTYKNGAYFQDLTDISVAVVFKADAVNKNAVLFSTGSNNRGFSLVMSDTGTLRVLAKQGSSGANSEVNFAGGTITTGTRYQAVVTFDMNAGTDNVHLYLNGAEANSVSSDFGANVTGSDHTGIGTFNTSASELGGSDSSGSIGDTDYIGTYGSFLGDIADVQVFDRALSSMEAGSLYASLGGSFYAFSALHGLTNGPSGDQDQDGLSNLREYALNGNPTNPADKGQTRLSNDGATLIYVYAQRQDDPSLLYTLRDTTNLVLPAWNTNLVNEGESAEVNHFKTITNTYPMVPPALFIELKVE